MKVHRVTVFDQCQTKYREREIDIVTGRKIIQMNDEPCVGKFID